jgi:hypothetical protein
MVKAELIKRSPLRILEQSMFGGLGKGNIGVLASRKGVGKTACLVHIATDKLFQGKPVIHVSYSSRVDYIINWYEDIFTEIAKKRNLEEAREVHDEIIRNRVIMNFKQEGSGTEQVLRSVEALITHGQFAAETVIVDGFDFLRSCREDLRMFRKFAQKLGLEVWFSASLRGEEPLFDDRGIPLLLKDCLDAIGVLVTLSSRQGLVRLFLVRNNQHPAPGELPLQLDPRTLLIAERD